MKTVHLFVIGLFGLALFWSGCSSEPKASQPHHCCCVKKVHPHHCYCQKRAEKKVYYKKCCSCCVKKVVY